MIVLFLLLLLLVILAIKDFVQGFRFNLSAYASPETLNAGITFLPPLLNIVIRSEGGAPVLTVYVFKLRLHQGILKPEGRRKGTSRGKRFALSAYIRHLAVSACYGTTDPFFTGIAYAALRLAATPLNIETLDLRPDFLSSEAYVSASANANLSISHTIINYARRR